jgi:hypothetical protein
MCHIVHVHKVDVVQDAFNRYEHMLEEIKKLSGGAVEKHLALSTPKLAKVYPVI